MSISELTSPLIAFPFAQPIPPFRRPQRRRAHSVVNSRFLMFYDDLLWRGLVHQVTEEETMKAWLSEKPRCVYAGFDPTADSLHIGNLMAIMMLRRFQRGGHRPIALVGGATGMIGDPTGKSEERNLLSRETLESNVSAIKNQIARFLDFGPGPTSAVLVNNLDWMGPYGYLEFLRDVGKHFPINVMLAKDSVKNRLDRESGISYTEFSYMLLQAFDFVKLHETLGCELQLGGSDQWGNITAGTDLGRRMRGLSLRGMTCPLLLKSDGTKMGKTEKGAVYLSADRTSPYAFYQYWINLGDVDAGVCLRYLTEIPREEIEALDKSRVESGHLRESQKRLAEAMTLLVHGEDGLASAKKATEILFGAEIANLDDRALGEIFADVPSREIPRQRIEEGKLTLVDALVETELAKSKSEARRTIEQKGAYVNNICREGADTTLSLRDLASESVIVLRSGKKKYALIRAS